MLSMLVSTAQWYVRQKLLRSRQVKREVITDSVYGVLQQTQLFPKGENSPDVDVLLQSADGRVLQWFDEMLQGDVAMDWQSDAETLSH